MRGRRLTLDEVKCRIIEKHGDLVTIIDDSYVRVNADATFVDVQYGTWITWPSRVMHGCMHPKRAKRSVALQTCVPLNDVLVQLRAMHGDIISLRQETYTGINRWATFVHSVHGDWRGAVKEVLKGRGHPNDTQRMRLASFGRHEPISHWKTGELCHSQSGYEYAILLWLNSHCYDYEWQVPFVTPFLTPKQKKPAVYYVDLLIKDGPFADLYVEIKGYWMHDGSQRKWEWFHDSHPNSELWMMSELLERGIISKRNNV